MQDNDFHAGELQAQRHFNTQDLWTEDRREQLLWTEIPEVFQQRFAAAPYFFLATSNAQGHCDCSFKGGGTGLIHLIDSKTFVFPDFDGNGAFMSIGNILENPYIGCLFIDFEDGARLRVNGKASVFTRKQRPDLIPSPEGPFHAAPRLVLIEVNQVIPNCNRHIPLMNQIKQEQT